MKILISAAEASSDTHGAALLRALREEAGAVTAFGIGGPGLQAEGLRAVVDARGLLSMGFLEIVSKLPRFLRSLARVAEAARVERPDVAVVIDYPDFHFRLARRLKALGIPVIYYIPPKVWVWRRKRVRVLRERFARVLSIFPFEAEFLRKEAVPVTYVGNPLVDELPLGLTKETARERLGLGARDAVLAVLPGSRPAELRYHLAPMLEAVRLSAPRLREAHWLGEGQALRVVIPLSAATDPGPVEAAVRAWRGAGADFDIQVRAGAEASALALVAADGGIVKSGTSTLEAGVLQCPHVVIYRPNAISSWIFHTFIRYKGPVGLVNLVGGYYGKKRQECPVPELICGEVTPEAMRDALVPMLADPARRAELLAYLKAVRAALMSGAREEGGPSRLAAREVLRVARERAPAAGAPVKPAPEARKPGTSR